jgi:hypothetical protein
MRERRGDAEALRRELARAGVDVSQLDRIVGQMRELEGRGPGGDPTDMAALQSAVLQGLKEFEFSLRRQIEGADRERLVLGGSEEVPAGYRKLVEEYYKSLAKKGQK